MGGGEREMDEKTRNQVMQNLFGDQSEDEPEEEDEDDDDDHDPDDADSDADSRRPRHRPQQRSEYHSAEGGEGDTELDIEGEIEAEVDIEGEGEVEGEGESEMQGEVEVESEPEVHENDVDQVESDGEKPLSSPERELSGQRMLSQTRDMDSDDDGHIRQTVKSRRKEIIASASEGSGDNYYDGNDVVNNTNKSRSKEYREEHEVVHDVFGDSEEDEPTAYDTQHRREHESQMSPLDDEVYANELRPEDVVQDEGGHYESDDENYEQKLKAKPVGPPLELIVPSHPPPGRPDKMNVIKVSNIMGIDQNPFEPKTYEEEEVFVMDESGSRKKIRLEENVVRWRAVKNRAGTTSYESNARFVKWKDGSIQLLIGNEVLDISVNESEHDHGHLFLRHEKGLLQSQGRLLQKMRFMPSSLSSKSHRLLTALVDSRHKKVHRVKNHVTEIDPEREKEERERMEGQNIRAHELLQRKREKVKGKYTQPGSKRKLSETYLEDRLEDDEELEDYHPGRRTRQSFEDHWEAEAHAEKRIMNAKKPNMDRSLPRKPSFVAARPQRRHADEYLGSEREESEYETDGEDIEFSPSHGREDGLDQEDEYEEDEDGGAGGQSMSDEEIEPKKKLKDRGPVGSRRHEIESDEDSPPRKQPTHRRMAVVSDSDEE